MFSERSFIITLFMTLSHSMVSGASFEAEVRPILEAHCFDCHGEEEKPTGGVNLEKFRTSADTLNERSIWGRVFDKVESLQMPPPKGKHQPSTGERQKVLRWIKELASLPDPVLGTKDPGKPVLRRLTRLEYNNTLRDVFGLRNDIFMFPERLPVDDPEFAPAAGKMPVSTTMTVREYGLKYPVLLPEAGLPGDSRAEHGFSNRGEAMNLSPLLLQKYLSTAREVVTNPKLPHQSAIFRSLITDPGTPAPAETGAQKEEADFTFKAAQHFAPNLDLPQQATRGGAVTVTYQFRFNVNTAAQEGNGGVWNAEQRNVIVPGETPVRIKYGLTEQKTLLLTPQTDLWVAGFSTAEETSGEGLFTNHEKLAKSLKFKLALQDSDPEERLTELAVCVLGRRAEKGEVTVRVIFSDGTTHTLAHNIDGGEGAGNTFFAFRAPEGLSIATMEVDGSKFSGNHVLLDDLGFITTTSSSLLTTPVAGSMNPRQKRQVAGERLADFLPRIFRHPINPKALDRYLTVYDAEIAARKPFAAAMVETVITALASPEFLYFPGPLAGQEPVRPLDGFELASRLSYFLWAAPPDDRLIGMAHQDALAQAATLADEASRMMQDVRIRELAESFAVQWLRLDQLYTAKPDPKLFSAFYFGQAGKRTLHGAFLVEALLLFHTVVVEDRSIMDFVSADYTWVNLRLMKHYGLTASCTEQVKSLGLQLELKDDLKAEKMNSIWWRARLPDHTRGGFITMAGPLAVTSLPTRTSPVKRGAWLLETIFNRPPQEPKIAFVLKEDDQKRTDTLTVRQRFEEHRNQSSCYSCHIRLDPPGFALEGFDPVGSQRTMDQGQPVDTSSEWNGVAFTGPAAFKSILRQHPQEFVRGFIEHLLSYAIGRKLEIYDLPAVDVILAAAAQANWRFSSIVRGIVQSYPFRYTRTL